MDSVTVEENWVAFTESSYPRVVMEGPQRHLENRSLVGNPDHVPCLSWILIRGGIMNNGFVADQVSRKLKQYCLDTSTSRSIIIII
jgi:6,7-dimethyl-8-ribityllumazine synthase